MQIDEMHYQFKLELQRIDSSDFTDFEAWEIDSYLNQAIDMFLKERYGILKKDQMVRGFETDMVRINQLATLHIKSPELQPALVPTEVVTGVYEINLNDLGDNISGQYFRYMFLTEGSIRARKGSCTKNMRLNPRRSNRRDTPYSDGSWKWERVNYSFGRSNFINPHHSTSGSRQDPDTTALLENNGRFNNDELYSLYLDTRNLSGQSQFTVDHVYLSYIKYPNRVFFSGYNHIDGLSKLLDPKIHCDLPEAFHLEIVRKAARIAAKNTTPDYQTMLVDEVKDMQY